MFFNKNGTKTSTRPLLNRVYPRAICGHGVYFNFNVTTNSFILIYDNNPDCKAETEIYINKKIKIVVNPATLVSVIDGVVYLSPHNHTGNIYVTGM